MSMLSKEELFGACRAIYDAASSSYMLPPLIRDAGHSEEVAKNTYYYFTENKCLRFIVEFDKAFVDSGGFPLSRLPLLFTCELCDLKSIEPPVGLTNTESQALIRAFFLGVKSPIVAEIGPPNVGVRLSAQLASTFFVDCGELGEDDGDLTSVAVCRKVSRSFYIKTSGFFENAKIGLAVWNVRAAEELFGYPRSSAETYWPNESRAAIEPRDADGGSCATAEESIFAGDAPTSVGVELIAPPPPVHRMLLARRASIFAPLKALGAAAAAAMVAALIFSEPPPKVEKLDARSSFADSAPLVVASATARIVSAPAASEEAATPAPILVSAPESAAQSAPLMGAGGGAPRQCAPTQELRSVQSPQRAVASQPQTTRRVKVAARTRQSKSDPIVALSRATEKFFARVIKDLRKVPQQISTTIAGG